jgi:predicted dehydrogenase
MASPVRIVLLGNSFARRIQLPALQLAGGNTVVGIAGHDGEKAAETAAEWSIPHSTGDWRELLALQPDLVIISTPVDLHAPMVRAALDAGANVLCEKPFTLDVNEAEELAGLAARSERLALVDHQLRWNPCRRKLRELVAAGYIGVPYHVRMDIVVDNPAFLDRPFGWWFQAERGGGVLGALGSHVIDGLQWMFGPVETVRARLKTFVAEREDSEGRRRNVTADDHAELWMTLESGLEASVTTSVAMPGASRFLIEVCGSEGTLRLDLEDDLIGGAHGAAMEPIELPSPPASAEVLGLEAAGPFAVHAPAFLGAVVGAVARGETTLPEAATFEDAVACMRVLEAARRSSRGGTRVRCK